MAENQSSQSELEKSLQRMMQTTKLSDNLQKMMKTTRSFDEELAFRREQSEKAIANAFAKMIDLTLTIEQENEQRIKKEEFRAKRRAINNAAESKDLVCRCINKLPAKYRNLPHAFRRNPQIVIKYFLGMIIGRVLAIVLYVIAAFIPALPVPDSVANFGGRALGGAVGAMRGFVADPSVIINVVTNIPTDINKLLQKIGEFFQFYGRRAWAFIVRAVRNPKLAYEDICDWSRQNARFFARLCRSAMALTFSFVMIKLAMIFLLPLFGGIALTVLGLKVSVLAFVVVRMIFDKVGEFIGARIFSKITCIYKFFKAVKQNLSCWK